MTTVFYIAFLVDHDIRERGKVVVDAGIDLLAGPYATHADAMAAIRATCRAHPRLAAFAGLAAFLMQGSDHPPIRLEVIEVTEAMVQRYVERYRSALPWPPPVVAPTDTARLIPTPKNVSRQ